MVLVNIRLRSVVLQAVYDSRKSAASCVLFFILVYVEEDKLEVHIVNRCGDKPFSEL